MVCYDGDYTPSDRRRFRFGAAKVGVEGRGEESFVKLIIMSLLLKENDELFILSCSYGYGSSATQEIRFLWTMSAGAG